MHVSEREGARHPEQHFAVRVDDVEGLAARLVEAGHPWQPKGQGRGTTADPEGNAVELLSG